MKGAEPLNKDQRRAVVAYYNRRGETRNRTLFLLGCATGYRISELCSLRIRDVLNEAGSVNQLVTVARRNMKGRKTSRTVLLSSAACRALLPWLAELRHAGYVHKTDPLFPSRTGKPVTRFQAYRVLKRAFRACGITGRSGTHTMRKTFANIFYDAKLREVAEGKPVDAFRETSKALGHASVASTDKYLSFRDEDIRQAIEELGEALI